MELDMPTQKLDRTGTKITIISNGDMFKSQCEALVNPVNTRGVMGKGLALAFKTSFRNWLFCAAILLYSHLFW